ncbi:DUF4232 domain-containing protein [Actinophytocola sp.]|uniref:DUF4232 domain-containing protein n=1 Tax=Actinophytocola sp. TaxID=1872138 RepID=UPI003D6C1461
MVLRTRVAAACAAAGFLAALSACGAQGSTGDSQPTGSPVTTPPSSAPATTPNSSGESSGGTESAPPGEGTKCTAKDLKGAIEPLDSAPGNRYAELVVTNRTKRPCTLYGYGGLEFIDQDGNPTPTDLTRQPAPGPSLVRLPPGGTAAKKLHWGVVPSGEEPDTGPCEPESAGARIIPPDDTQAFIVTHEFGSVCAGGHVEGSAYFKK